MKWLKELVPQFSMLSLNFTKLESFIVPLMCPFRSFVKPVIISVSFRISFEWQSIETSRFDDFFSFFYSAPFFGSNCQMSKFAWLITWTLKRWCRRTVWRVPWKRNPSTDGMWIVEYLHKSQKHKRQRTWKISWNQLTLTWPRLWIIWEILSHKIFSWNQLLSCIHEIFVKRLWEMI